jgi:hypothetical protein
LLSIDLIAQDGDFVAITVVPVVPVALVMLVSSRKSAIVNGPLAPGPGLIGGKLGAAWKACP